MNPSAATAALLLTISLCALAAEPENALTSRAESTSPFLLGIDEETGFVNGLQRGDGSFLYWLPVKGTGPILVMQPREGTGLEFFTAGGMDYAFGRDQFTAFIHSKATAEIETRGTWRQTRTSRILEPQEQATYGFALRWADSYHAVRDLLYRHEGFDIRVAPGMVVPRDQTAMIAVRTRRQIKGVVPEFPDETVVEYAGNRGSDMHLFRLTLNRLGENLLTIRTTTGQAVPLEFFVTEPLETLIKKRAAFIVKHQQHRNPDQWYDGLYSLWDRSQSEGRNLLGPDHPGGQHPYAVSGSDDPSNSKCLLVAEKNVAYPNAAEIESLEYFVTRFVWGKHQRTDAEMPYPYGIYGSDSWKQNRDSGRDPLDTSISRPGGPSECRMWRTFDYTTYFVLYFDLYRIAKQQPDLVKTLDAAGYLERAYGTALAYFEVPANIRMEGGWSFTGWVYWQYTVGNFHEKYLLPLIAALEAACTVLFDDPIFGLFAYGGQVRERRATIEVIPRDGVRQRFHAVLGSRQLHLTLESDGFAKEQSLVLPRQLDGVCFKLESRTPQAHHTTLTVEGLPPGDYSVTTAGVASTFRAEAGRSAVIQLPVDPGSVDGDASVSIEPRS